MIDERILARNWAGWFGITGAAQGMGVSAERIKELLNTPTPNQPAKKEISASAIETAVENDTPEKKTRSRYTPEQKENALHLLAELGPTRAAKETGISVASLMKWRQESLATDGE